ncbi:MAG TPA: IclR family transcriptional regulator [Segeticoccus sp.]|uniref:IclR family transcriptional regulator n=1 Tax=Segeticoccus sp. TaxID=2706531 RepID=UPI002D7E9FFF|nr:IclR family transcriptional regulator [Segeticoccus sp.]HET8599470.1 IclR family transcriptional regulator [Segeticoccus sp.]
MGQGTQSIDRAAELLSLVIHAPTAVTYTELVETTGLARSTVSRLLAALERNGLLERDPEGAFRGGAMFTHYATRFDRVESLVAVAQPYLERIGEHTGETVNLGVPRGDTVVHVAQVDSRYVVGATSWVDVDVPPHCSALGKVMYAFDAIPLPDGPLPRCTSASLPDRSALLRELERIRERGFAETSGEFEEGLDAVAAPVRGADGLVHAAIGVSGPTFRLEGEHEELGALVVAESERLSRALAKLG